MATRDHTARFCRSVPADVPLTGSPDDLRPRSVTPSEASPRSTRATIALAVLTLTRLRHDSEQAREAQARGFPVRSLMWPLSEVETTRLGIAVQCLQQYARLLGLAPRASCPPGH